MSKVINFQKKRGELVEKKRRNFERVIFDNFLGAYSSIDEQGGIYPIFMVDISETGCLFQIPYTKNSIKKFTKGKNVNLRMYFTEKSYLSIGVNIKYAKKYLEKDGAVYMRYGCEFDTSTESFRALNSFIQFLYQYSDLSHLDNGDAKVYFL